MVPGNGLGLGLGFNRGGGGLDSYSPETSAYLAAVTNNTFSDAEKLALDTMIISLVANGIWAKLDQFYLLCAKTSTETESRVNLIYPTAGANSTPSADPKRAISKNTNGGAQLVWTSGSGYATTDGGEKLTGNYIPDGANQFKDENSHIMVYVGNNVDASANGVAVAGSAASPMYQISPRVVIGTCQARFGKASTIFGPLNDNTKGLYIVNRAVADTNKVTLTKDGSEIGSQTGSNQTMPSSAMSLFFWNDSSTSYFAGIIGAHSIGGGLTATQIGQYSTALNTFLSAMGAK